MKNYIWSNEEKEYLINNYNKLSAKEIGLFLDRSDNAVRYMAGQLNILKFPNWNQEELDFLINNYSILNNKKISKILNRTMATIQTKACELGLKKDKKSLEVEFLNRVIKNCGHGPNGDCWLWVGSKYKSGYGRIGINNKNIRAHRVSYEIYVENIPQDKDYHIMHLCNTKDCVNPNHLQLGDIKLNSFMASKDGLYKSCENNCNSKLSNNKVKLIREMYELLDKNNKKVFKQKDLSKIFGISQSRISSVIRKETYKAVI